MGFGQVVALGLMALPALAFAEIYNETKGTEAYKGVRFPLAPSIALDGGVPESVESQPDGDLGAGIASAPNSTELGASNASDSDGISIQVEEKLPEGRRQSWY
ncbi:hypothetical protein BCR34DRAFT_599374 [Clohesyomyces aquaticus]|uniref:Uncharacterized protein n=1 Tax=Clohesyomyces aquaticus TaxID=1231657 RepID=A0A1Y1ZV76_9PLEO|nr:hypothetical protein BCR34DRAFT_599374 [Clohesyomyces aquaticus]